MKLKAREMKMNNKKSNRAVWQLKLPFKFVDKLRQDWESLLAEEGSEKPELVPGLAKYAAATLIPANRDGLTFLRNVIDDLVEQGKPKDEDNWRALQTLRVAHLWPEWAAEIKKAGESIEQ